MNTNRGISNKGISQRSYDDVKDQVTDLSNTSSSLWNKVNALTSKVSQLEEELNKEKDKPHNDSRAIQGGSYNERFHLTRQQYTYTLAGHFPSGVTMGIGSNIWRLYPSGTNLYIQKYNGSSWITKTIVTV